MATRPIAVPAATTPTGDRLAGQEPRQWPAVCFGPRDVFELEWVHDPRISPDGKRIVYVRRSFDIMTDRVRSNLWIVDADGSNHQPLVSGPESVDTPRFSLDGKRLLYTAEVRGKKQLFVRWLNTGRTALITNVIETPADAEWSPDGRWIALTMNVPAAKKPMITMPDKPEGAEWAESAKVIDRVRWRSDGEGYIAEGYRHVFVVPADGGTPRQLTTGNYDHGSPPGRHTDSSIAWMPDGGSIVVSANRNPDWQYQPRNSEIYAVDVLTAKMSALTARDGPDASPAVSPDGKRIAYVGFDDRKQSYQLSRLYLMDRDGSDARLITGEWDRAVEAPRWAADGRGLYFQYEEQGNSKLGFVNLDGRVTELLGDIGGTSIGRPYASGSFTVSRRGRIAFTRSRPEHPADLAVRDPDGRVRTLVRLNEDLFAHKTLGTVEELWTRAPDGRDIQAWMVKPPGFDPQQRYPLILEIHGGPFASYGDRFSAEMQLYAAAGYMVLYVNPRGSTGYGEDFGNLIHHAYPGDDYDDLIAAVDAVIARGNVDPARLYVTGGSGGGVLTAWTVGKTARFRAAVVAKPVVNWTSFVLYADASIYFTQYWFPAMPWEAAEHYMKRSPLSLVGHVTTPTLLLTGEIDYRTPIGESEQYYQALKLRKVDTALVRVPGASHHIAARPSHLVSKVLHILAWFDKYAD